MASRSDREIRPLKPEDMDEYIVNYMNAYPAGKDMSEAGAAGYKMRNMQSLAEYNDVNYYGMFEEGRLIAQMKLIDFDINLFGQMKKATGLMALAVHPLHKKRGAARQMVEFFQNYTVKSGGIVSMLLPFRIDFYRRMGYGCGTRLEEYRIKTVQLPQCPKEKLSGLRLLTLKDIDKVIECYTSFAENNHGRVLKFGEELREMRENEEIQRIGLFRNHKLAGYAAFNYVPDSDTNYTLNILDVRELVYDNGDTLLSLLGGLRLQSDLCSTVVIRTGEADFYHLFESPQNISGNYTDFGFLETNSSYVGTMYKICDIPRFVGETSHRRFPLTEASELRVKFDIYDEMHEDTASYDIIFFNDKISECGRWKMADDADLSNSNDKNDCSKEVRVSCRLSDFSALLMGSCEFSSMFRLGLADISDEHYVSVLDSIFHCEQKPFTNTDY